MLRGGIEYVLTTKHRISDSSGGGRGDGGLDGREEATSLFSQQFSNLYDRSFARCKRRRAYKPAREVYALSRASDARKKNREEKL